jgi:outer membrane protein TolC
MKQCWGLLFACLVVISNGCRSPSQYRARADKAAYDIIQNKQQEAVHKTEPFRVERPSDILRRRLIEEQGLPISGPASLGTDQLEPIPYWPDKDYPAQVSSVDANIPVEPNRPLKMSLVEALRVAASNSPDYQTQKESVFQSALALDLRRNDFRTIFTFQANTQLSVDTTGEERVETLSSGANVGVDRTLKNGLGLSAILAVNLLNLLTQGGAQTLGLSADPSISLPLLRGAGRHIVTEPLTQAERDVVYSMWDFERYKRTFAVNVAQNYLSVLRQMDSLTNNENNYRSSIQSARWSRRQADAGRIAEIEVDQAVQRELSSRNGWISAQEQLNRSVDSFKTLIGLPTDSLVEMDPNELVELRKIATKYVDAARSAAKSETKESVPPADAEVTLESPSREGAGPYEMDESVAIDLALENRLDLRAANGEVYDAQRQVVVAADALRAGLTVGGSASFSDNDNDGSWRLQGAQYAATASLDLPIDPRSRADQQNRYRTSLINLERATRNVQTLEDQIKQSVRNELRTLLESRETLKIQAQSVVVAEKRVKSVTLFLEAGRAAIRDLLDAQDSLLSAQNQLTAAVINYRTAELQLQRDLDLLTITQQGLMVEFTPGDNTHGI